MDWVGNCMVYAQDNAKKHYCHCEDGIELCSREELRQKVEGLPLRKKVEIVKLWKETDGIICEDCNGVGCREY